MSYSGEQLAKYLATMAPPAESIFGRCTTFINVTDNNKPASLHNHILCACPNCTQEDLGMGPQDRFYQCVMTHRWIIVEEITEVAELPQAVSKRDDNRRDQDSASAET